MATQYITCGKSFNNRADFEAHKRICQNCVANDARRIASADNNARRYIYDRMDRTAAEILADVKPASDNPLFRGGPLNLR